MTTETIIAVIAFFTLTLAFLGLLGTVFAYLVGRLDRYVTHTEMAAQMTAHSERMNLLYDGVTEARNLAYKAAFDQRDSEIGAGHRPTTRNQA